MSEFSTQAQLSLGVEDGAISSVRQQIESGLEDIGIGLTGGDVTFALEGRSQDILDGILQVSTSIAERTGRTADALEGEDGGGRERRRRRQEFRWSRENTSNIEDAVTLLESIDDTLDEQGGGGGGLISGISGIIGGVGGAGGKAAGGAVGGGVGTSALGLGAGAGLAGLGVGAGAGLAGAGIGAGIGAAKGNFASEEFSVEVGTITTTIEEVNPSIEGPFIDEFSIGENALSVGEGAFSVGEDAFSVQEGAFTVGEEALSIQEGALTVGQDAIRVGEGAFTIGSDAVNIGENAFTLGEDVFTIGEGAFSVSPEFNLSVEASLGDVSIDFAPEIDFSPSVRIGVDTDLSGFADEATDLVLQELNPAQKGLVDNLRSEVDRLERTIERELG